MTPQTFVMVTYGLILAGLLIVVSRLIYSVLSTNKDEPPRFQSHWGGFGGGLGGWQMSRSLAYLLAATIFAALAVITTTKMASLLIPPAKEEQQAGSQNQAPRNPAPGDTTKKQASAGAGVDQVLPAESLQARISRQQATTTN